MCGARVGLVSVAVAVVVVATETAMGTKCLKRFWLKKIYGWLSVLQSTRVAREGASYVPKRKLTVLKRSPGGANTSCCNMSRMNRQAHGLSYTNLLLHCTSQFSFEAEQNGLDVWVSQSLQSV
jgi:hypothetical protein